MQEDDRFVVGTDFRLRAQTADAFFLDLLHGLVYVVNFDANVVQASRLVLVQISLEIFDTEELRLFSRLLGISNW